MKIPGIGDLDKIAMGIDNQRLSALLCAVLEAHGGFTVIPKNVSERTYEGYELDYAKLEGGAIKVTLKRKDDPVPEEPSY